MNRSPFQNYPSGDGASRGGAEAYCTVYIVFKISCNLPSSIKDIKFSDLKNRGM